MSLQSKSIETENTIEINNATKIRTKDIELDENVSFEDMLLLKPILEGLKNAGFYKPSPIQLKAIPLGKLGLDMIVQAKSGTGKTCVFSVISLEHVLASKNKALQVLVLAPTREVAIQISDSIKVISSAFSSLVKCSTFIGGQSLKQDKLKLKSCQIAVGTPGRILHLINENMLNTSNIRLFIMDEADKLLEPEFQETINLIYSKLPDNKQMIFLSATYPSYMASYATRYMRSPTFVRLNIIDPSLRGIKQYYKITPYSNQGNKSFDYKIDSLIKLLSSVQFQQAIIFTNYQIKAESLCKTLTQKGWQAIFTSGHIEQNQRNFAMNQLKQFKCRILVSTDLTSRGVDAQNVDLVISMDLPTDPETYLHRIGRAGRYGCQGIAVSFVTEKDEAAQFEEIIDSYCLRIKQFNDNLDDIIVSRNDINEVNRKDDITIEKVSLTKEQLDKSLFEYEQNKNLKKITTGIKALELTKTEQKIDLNKKSKRNENMCSISDIEKDFTDFLNNKENYTNKNFDVYTNIQKSKCKILNDKCLKLNPDCIDIKLVEIEKDLNFKLGISNFNQTATDNKVVESIDLNTLYKWEPIDKTKKNEKPIEKIQNTQQVDFKNKSNKSNIEQKTLNDQELQQQTFQAYSFYYNKFYKYYFDKFFNKK